MGLRSLGQCAPMRGLLRAGECRAERGRWGRELSEGVAPLVSTGCPSPKCLPSMSVDGSHLSWVTSYQGRLKQWLWAQPWDKRDGGGKAPPSRILLSRKPRPLQHVLQHWTGGGGAACPQAPSAPPRPGASGARVTPPPGCGHPHPSSSRVQELGLSLSPVCFTLAVLLGGIRIHTSVPLLPWFLPLVFPAAPEASPPPGLWAPWLHPHSQDLQEFFHFWKVDS